MYQKRHKWNSKIGRKATSNLGGLAVYCLKCGCVKEYVSGLPIYFIDDTVYYKAPTCDERLLNEGIRP